MKSKALRAALKRLPDTLTATGGCEVQIQAAAADDGKPALPRFKGIAYTGGMMQPEGWEHPVVVDLEGVSWTEKSRPILKDHDPGKAVGHSEAISIEGSNLLVSGIISGTGEHAREVRDNAANGFPWQMSIGAAARKVQFVKAGEDATVNGGTFTGPIYVIRKASLGEISFVALGADDATEAGLAAKAALLEKERTMEFAQWVMEKFGLDVSALTEEQIAKMQAIYDAEAADMEAGEGEGDEGEAGMASAAAKANLKAAAKRDATVIDVGDQIKAIRAENARIDSIRAIAGEDKEICARAISEGWTAERAELAVLKAKAVRDAQDAKVGSPAVIVRGGAKADRNVLEAACALSTGLHDAEKKFDEKTLDAAHKRFRHGIGLQEVLLECAWSNGFHGSSFRADPQAVLKAAFSTKDIDGILSATANKHLVDAFMAVEDTWSRITARRNAVDFKTMTGYRLTGDMEYSEVGNGGELKHATLGEASYTNKVDTYGKLFAITRQDLINDDLGALSDISRRLGRGAALKINTVFWTAFMDNATFFTEARGNYATGTATALGVDGLTAAELLFLNQTDDDGKPLAVMPRILLVPNALYVTAAQTMNSTELRDTTASKKYGVTNPHAGKFTVERSSYLSNSSITGYSAAAWYLLADPQDMPVIETAFLNGKEQPTVESADADFNTLGIQFRGYHDFGVSKQEYRGGVKMLGEAAGS